jgi:hypothetical protein
MNEDQCFDFMRTTVEHWLEWRLANGISTIGSAENNEESGQS